MSRPYGIPWEEFATQQKEANEDAGLLWCDSCSEWKPAEEVKAHAGVCQECWETTEDDGA